MKVFAVEGFWHKDKIVSSFLDQHGGELITRAVSSIPSSELTQGRDTEALLLPVTVIRLLITSLLIRGGATYPFK